MTRIFPMMIRGLMPLLLALTVQFFAGLPTVAQAQTPAVVESDDTTRPSPNDIRELMRLLADPAMRNWLEHSANDQPEAEPEQTIGYDLRQELALATNSIHSRLSDLSTLWSDIPSAFGFLVSEFGSSLSQHEILRTLTYGLIFLFIGASLEWLYRQYVRYRLMQIEFTVPASFSIKFRSVLARAGISLGALLFFACGGIGAFLLFEWPQTIRVIVLDFLVAVLLLRFVHAILELVLAPRLPNLRLVAFTTKRARQIYLWVMVLSAFGIFANFTYRVFLQTLGTMNDPEAMDLVTSINILNAIIFSLLALAAVWTVNRHFLAQAETGAPGRLSNKWPTYLSVLILLVLALFVMNAGPLTGTALIVGVLLPVIVVSGKWVESLFDQAAALTYGRLQAESEKADLRVVEAETGPAEVLPDLNLQPFQIYRSIARRLVRFMLIALAIVMLVSQWDINLFALSASQTFSGKFFDVLVDTLFALLLADLIWHWAKSSIDRRLADYTPPPDGQAPGPEARMATLLPMLRMILMLTLLVVVVLSILSSLGVNIAPLLAGAGVLGVAIGFGAQALVRDVVSGIFFLIDDAFRIGEYIEIDNLRGTVESMSIRSLRVRHHRGMIHTIPFGELKSLTNYSRDWVIMKLEFRVPFDTDLQLVKKLVKKIGAELLENETYGKSIIQTLKSQGVRRMEEFNMVVGVKFMAKPGEQWLIRRDAYQKVRDAFDAHGIGFAERNVKVQVISDHPLNAATRDQVMGAAQDAIEQRMPPVPVRDEP